MWPFRRKNRAKPAKSEQPLLMIDRDSFSGTSESAAPQAWPHVTQPSPVPTVTLDAFGGAAGSRSIKQHAGYNDAHAGFFGAGARPLPYRALALLSTNWLIERACGLPARDSLRKGYDLGDKADALRETDDDYELITKAQQLIYFGRLYGAQAALFNVQSDISREQWLGAPFNPDGVAPKSYKGITLVDTQWLRPDLSETNLADPSAPDFYVPRFWRVGNMRIHKSHLHFFVPHPVPPYLKPAYNFLGVSVTQMIIDRVYAAERSANEVPALLMTKRMNILKLANLEGAKSLDEKLNKWVQYMNNYGIKTLGADDEFSQHDTHIGGVDDTVMTQYQLVASAANIPVTRLLGTTPKGFQSTGAHDAENYRQSLESIQTHDLTPLLQRHYELVARSEGLDVGRVKVSWEAVDSPTAAERSEINHRKAQEAAILYQTGAIDAEDIRDRLAEDEMSDYFRIKAKDLDDDGSFGGYEELARELGLINERPDIE